MKNIISISRRTDIPHFYTRWLLEALRCGQATYTLPRGGRRSVSIRPEDVHSLVFWSKDYGPLLQNPELCQYLKSYNVYFHFSITGLGGSFLEPGVPTHSVALEEMRQLVNIWGVERVEWRFDPVIHWKLGDTIESNAPLFQQLAFEVGKMGVKRCTFSFATLYDKVLRTARKYGFTYVDPTYEEKLEILRGFASVASAAGVELYSCAASEWTRVTGIQPARCVDAELLTRLHPQGELAENGKDKSQRAECLCAPSVDIGSYDQGCPGGCLYCYAHPRIQDSIVRSLLHAPESSS